MLDLPKTPGSSRRRKSFYGKTMKEARAKLERYRSLQAAGVHTPDDRLTFAQFTQTWLQHTAPLNAKPSTISNYRMLLDK